MRRREVLYSRVETLLGERWRGFETLEPLKMQIPLHSLRPHLEHLAQTSNLEILLLALSRSRLSIGSRWSSIASLTRFAFSEGKNQCGHRLPP